MDDLDLNARLLDFVKSVTTAMGLSLEAAVEETPDGPRVNLTGDDGELLLRHKAEGLQALIASYDNNNPTFPDVDGDKLALELK